jgi:hypothetical protein
LKSEVTLFCTDFILFFLLQYSLERFYEKLKLWFSPDRMEILVYWGSVNKIEMTAGEIVLKTNDFLLLKNIINHNKSNLNCGKKIIFRALQF